MDVTLRGYPHRVKLCFRELIGAVLTDNPPVLRGSLGMEALHPHIEKAIFGLGIKAVRSTKLEQDNARFVQV